MDPKIIEKGEMLLVGMVWFGGDIGALWDRFSPDEDLIKHKIAGAWYELHAYPKDHTPGGPCYYMAAVAVTEVKALPDDMFVKPLPAGCYAVFAHRCGVDSYDVVNGRINEWLEKGPYKLARNFSLQRYDARFKGFSEPDSELDLMIPIEPKSQGG